MYDILCLPPSGKGSLGHAFLPIGLWFPFYLVKRGMVEMNLCGHGCPDIHLIHSSTTCLWVMDKGSLLRATGIYNLGIKDNFQINILSTYIFYQTYF